MEHVILVDEYDKEVGTSEKIQAHKEGKLHRAFSIFVFNKKGDILLQKRAAGKYHSGGLWTNTCCGHPRPGENIEEAAHRRLQEEMGFDCILREIFAFTYRTEFENGLQEHEYDHVLVGMFEGKVDPDPEEAEGFAWIPLEEVQEEVEKNPEEYTFWFRQALGKFADLA